MNRRSLYLILVILVILVGAGIVASLYVQAGRHITTFEENRPLPGAVLYDNNGDVIKRLGTGSVYVALDQTPQQLQNAVKATHESNVINQSLARRILDPQGMWARLQLALLPSVIQRRYSERERLELYLNSAYFGEGAYGVEAASQTYFAKPVIDIDLAQSALLAALAQEPEEISPFSEPNQAKDKRNSVLVQMQGDGHISKSQQDEAAQAPIDPKRRAPGYAHHFSDYLGELLISELGEEQVFQGGIRVSTTLNRELQLLAEGIFRDRELDGGLVAIDPTDGAILAMVGGRDYLEDSTNLATVDQLEVGSTLRPLIYATGLQEDWAMNHLVEDIQREFGEISVENADDRYWGPVTMKHALVMDLNNAAIWTLNELGIERFDEFARSVNLNIEEVDKNLLLAMGQVREGLSLLELTAAYQVGASEGQYMTVSSIEEVTDTQNRNVLGNQKSAPRRILSTEQAYLLTDMLIYGTEYGSIRELDLAFPGALSASSSTDGTSQWAIGYTPSLLVGVYVKAPESTEEVPTSRLLAGETWVQFITEATAMKDEDETSEDNENDEANTQEFKVPENVEIGVLIDVFTGLLASERCPQTERDAFIEGTKPTRLAPCALPPPEPPPAPVIPPRQVTPPIQPPEPIPKPEPAPKPEPEPIEPEPEPEPQPEPEPIQPIEPIQPTPPTEVSPPPEGSSPEEPPAEETPPPADPAQPMEPIPMEPTEPSQ